MLNPYIFIYKTALEQVRFDSAQRPVLRLQITQSMFQAGVLEQGFAGGHFDSNSTGS